MKIQFVGTGDIWNKSNSACYLIDGKVLIDIPNGTMKALKKQNVNIKKIKNILITHFHGDHYFDMPFYFLAKGQNSEKDHTYLYLNFKGKKKIKKLFMLAFPRSVFKVLKKTKVHYINRKRFKIDNYFYERIKMQHGKMRPSYGYVATAPGLTVGFTGDSAYCDSVEEMASKCDYLICDCTYEIGNERHMGINNIVTLSEKFPKCRFIASHMSQKAFKELKRVGYHNIIIPKDGEILKLEGDFN